MSEKKKSPHFQASTSVPYDLYASASIFKVESFFFAYFDPENIFLIMRINIFWGDLTDKKEALLYTSKLGTLQIHVGPTNNNRCLIRKLCYKDFTLDNPGHLHFAFCTCLYCSTILMKVVLFFNASPVWVEIFATGCFLALLGESLAAIQYRMYTASVFGVDSFQVR